MTTAAEQELADVAASGFNDDQPTQPALDGMSTVGAPVVKLLGAKATDLDDEEVGAWRNKQAVRGSYTGTIIHTGHDLDKRSGTEHRAITVDIETVTVELAE
jgi:hypothetical protein